MVVSDALDHTLSEYSYTTTSNAVAQVGTTFSFTPDPAAGAISPQEIAIDGSGNLWTTSAGGNIAEYCGNSLGCTLNSASVAAGAVMQTVTIPTADGAPRGIMVDTHSGSVVYVTTSSYGASGAGVYQFTLNASTGAAGSVSTYAALSANTNGGQETGQLRGLTYDSGGNIYFADSTWGAPETDHGYIDENGLTQVVTSLDGPNELQVGGGTGTGNTKSSCDVIYDTNYYAGTVTEVSTGWNTSGGNTGCGSIDAATTTYLTGLTAPSGIALAFGNHGLGDFSPGPEGLFEPDAATPEPGTWVLALSALSIGVAFKARRGVSVKVS